MKESEVRSRGRRLRRPAGLRPAWPEGPHPRGKIILNTREKYMVKDHLFAEDLIYWVRSQFGTMKDRVPMIYKSQLYNRTGEGERGDVRVRPESLGTGEHTMVVSESGCVREGRWDASIPPSYERQ